MEIDFSAKMYTAAEESSNGFMVFIGGTPQLISLNGSEPSDLVSYMAKNEEVTECKIRFTPRLTQEDLANKDDLTLLVCRIWNPLFMTTGSAENIDYEHFISVFCYQQFKVDGDCETVELTSDSPFKYYGGKDTAIKKYVTNSTGGGMSLEYAEDNKSLYFNMFSQDYYSTGELKPFIQNGKTDLAVTLYGGEGVGSTYRIYFYKNHKQIKINGNDFLKAEIKAGLVGVYEFTLDDVQDHDFVYAIAVRENISGFAEDTFTLKTDTRRVWTKE